MIEDTVVAPGGALILDGGFSASEGTGGAS